MNEWRTKKKIEFSVYNSYLNKKKKKIIDLILYLLLNLFVNYNKYNKLYTLVILIFFFIVIIENHNLILINNKNWIHKIFFFKKENRCNFNKY